MKSCTILSCSICLCFPLLLLGMCHVRTTDWAMEEYTSGLAQSVTDPSYGGIWISKPCSSLRYRKQTEVRTFRLTSVVSCWRIPIFPGRLQPSIFGTTELNFCVRNGNRWTLCVNLTNFLLHLQYPAACNCNRGNLLLSGCTFRDSNPGPTD